MISVSIIVIAFGFGFVIVIIIGTYYHIIYIYIIRRFPRATLRGTAEGGDLGLQDAPAPEKGEVLLRALVNNP